MDLFRITRVIAPLLAVAVLAAGVVYFATDGVGQTTSACRAQNKGVAQLKDVEGNSVGKVTFGVHASCKTKVTADLVGLSQGFHGFHVHTTGTCDPEATDASNNPSPFFTAGSHWNTSGSDHGSHTGDLAPVLAMDTGAAFQRSLTDRFQARELFDEDGSAVIVHAGSDNLANVPEKTSTGDKRYHSHAYDTFGPDEDSRKTGDAGTRFACGVVKRIKN